MGEDTKPAAEDAKTAAPPAAAEAAAPEAAAEEEVAEDAQQDIISPRGAETLSKRTRRHWLASVRKVFEKFDDDGSGSIDNNEFGQALEGIGLHLDDESLKKLVRELDLNGDGQVDFDEFVNFLETNGMGPDAGRLGVTDAMKLLNREVKSTILNVSEADAAAIAGKATALCPKKHSLEKVTLEELNLEKFYFGLDGFVCGKCDIQSGNLVNKSAYLCSTCQYVLCSLCAHVEKTANVDAMIKSRVQGKRSQIWAFSQEGQKKQSNKEMVNRKRGNKGSTKLVFGAGGMRASVSMPMSMEGIEGLPQNPENSAG